MSQLHGFVCPMHGLTTRRCCGTALETGTHPMVEFARTYLKRVFPHYFPVNWEECFTAMFRHSFVPEVIFVRANESRDDIVQDSLQWFNEREFAERFFSALSEPRVRYFAQRIRARTNVLAVMQRPLVREARFELQDHFPKFNGFWAAGGNLDRGIRLANRQYDGRAEA